MRQASPQLPSLTELANKRVTRVLTPFPVSRWRRTAAPAPMRCGSCVRLLQMSPAARRPYAREQSPSWWACSPIRSWRRARRLCCGGCAARPSAAWPFARQVCQRCRLLKQHRRLHASSRGRTTALCWLTTVSRSAHVRSACGRCSSRAATPRQGQSGMSGAIIRPQLLFVAAVWPVAAL